MTINQIANFSNAYRNMYVNQVSSNKSLQRLSSGYRINSAADDAAGLAVSEKMRGQIGGLTVASQNIQNGMSMIQTADGHLDTAHSVLNRMSELATQASNGTYTDDQRALLDLEFQELKDTLTSMSSSANYNGIKLLDGSLDTMFQVGANGTADQQIGLQVGDVSATGLSLNNLSIANIKDAQDALKGIDAARDIVSSERANLSSKYNRLEYTLNNVGVTRENMIASESRIRDADMAQEIMNYTKYSIQTQASQAMSAQGMNLSRQYMIGLLMMM